MRGLRLPHLKAFMRVLQHLHEHKIASPQESEEPDFLIFEHTFYDIMWVIPLFFSNFVGG